MMKHPEDNPGYIIVTGAFERDNFGDILFGEIALSVLNKFPIILASLISNSMEAFGSRTVASLLDFAAANRGHPPAMIVHAGGEILSCSLASAILMNIPVDLAPQVVAKPHGTQQKLVELLTQARGPLGYLWEPASLGLWAGRLIHFEVISAGGVEPVYEHWPPEDVATVERILKTIDRIEVRDMTTRNILKQRFGIHVNLGVDIVFGIHHFCAPAIKNAKRDLISSSAAPYFIFQISRALLEQYHPGEIVQQIVEIARELNCSVIIQPAGLAAFHDDAEVLIALANSVSSAGVTCHYEPDRHVWRQVARIANAKLYIGSSLHGRIIATGAAVPSVSLTGTKAAANGSSWGCDPATFDVAPNQIIEAARITCNTTPGSRQDLANKLSNTAQASLMALSERARHHMGKRRLATPAELAKWELEASIAETRRLRRRIIEQALDSSEFEMVQAIQHYEMLKSELYAICDKSVFEPKNSDPGDDASSRVNLNDTLLQIMTRLIEDTKSTKTWRR